MSTMRKAHLPPKFEKEGRSRNSFVVREFKEDELPYNFIKKENRAKNQKK